MLLAPGVVAQTVMYDDDFEAGVSGWSSNTAETNPITGQFLGRFGPGRPSNSTQRNFMVPPNTDFVVVEFDFLEIDSWDGDQGDEFAVDIDGTRIFSLAYFHEGRAGTDGNDAAQSGTTGSVDWSVSPLTDNTISLGFITRWNDQLHRGRLVLNNPGTDFDLRFVADIDQSDEAIGIDNVTIIAYPAPALTVEKESNIIAGGSGFAAPGDTVRYVIRLTNAGSRVDNGALIVTDLVPPELELFTGANGASSSAVMFNDLNASGLACCTPAQVTFASTTSPSDPFTYAPNGAFDNNVRQIRIVPTGAFRNGVSSNAIIEFELLARIR
ncbi:MAG: hypothetical protein AAGL10_16430 [Pseudomonadota bacterium]